jgi:Mrp family chromosome partitioning ATPase
MGRMLEVLTRSRSRPVAAEEKPEPDAMTPAPVLEAAPDESFPGDDTSIPFVEVGGPRPEAGRAHTVEAPTNRGTSGVGAAMRVPKAHVHSIAYLAVQFQAAATPLPAAAGSIAVEVVAQHHPEHPASAQYGRLWGDLIANPLRSKPEVLVFTSPETGSGTTTVVLNLAITAARDPAVRIVLIDADHQRPAIADRLGLAAAPGLGEWLAHPYPVRLALQPTALPNLQVVAGGCWGDAARPGERLSGLLGHLRQRFDWVFVDAGPWSEESVAPWAKRSDATYLVVRQSAGDTPEAGRVHEELVRNGGPLRGYILTAV